MGTNEQQAVIGSILPSGGPAHRAPLTGVIRIHPNRHTTRQPGCIRGFGLHIRKAPNGAAGFFPADVVAAVMLQGDDVSL